jgi:diguanylate cyclase (GGDEF)-like protein
MVVFRIIAIIAVVELVIMLFLVGASPGMYTYTIVLLDVILLVILSTPLILTWVIKPFVIARDEAAAQVTHLAFHDPLTQLANRRLLTEYLHRTIAGLRRHGLHAALLLIDLDRFKPINDEHGHDAGDAVLIEIADRLRSEIRDEDVACRLGGDEFVILLDRLDTEAQAAHDKALQMAQRLLNNVQMPIDYKGMSLRVGASIGLRILDAAEIDANTAIKEADMAMYQAKEAGGGRVAVYGQ